MLLCALAGLLRPSRALNLADVPCGQQKLSVVRQARVTGGRDAHPGQFPWSASVQEGGVHFCMGAVVGRRYVLTAAHCFSGRPAGRFTVSVGGHRLSAAEPSRRAVPVARLLVHPQYRDGRFESDVALLRLSEPLVWSDRVQPVCLPPAGADSGPPEDGHGQVAGWGYLAEWRDGGGAGSRPADALQWVSVPLLSRQTCQRWYAAAGRPIKVRRGKLCAGYREGGRDSCRADSGAALTVHTAGGGAHAVGLVSAGIGCGRPGLPGLYTDVAHYTKWIARHAGG